MLTVQQRLTELGYDPGPVDGVIGSRTRGATRAFQADAGLPVDGQISDQLIAALSGPGANGRSAAAHIAAADEGTGAKPWERYAKERRLEGTSTGFAVGFALWVEGQVAALRAGDVAALDLPNLIEELEGLTKRDERALGSQLKRIMAHLLKQRSQPERASRSRVGSIENGREEIADILEQSPSLRHTLPGLMSENHPRAVAQATRDTRLPVQTFPTEPPFTLEEVLGEAERSRAKVMPERA